MSSLITFVKDLSKAESVLLKVESDLLDSSISGLFKTKNYEEYSVKIFATVSYLNEINEQLSHLQPHSKEVGKTLSELQQSVIMLGAAAAQLNTVNEGLQNKASGRPYPIKAYHHDVEEYKFMKHLYNDCKKIFLSTVELYSDELAQSVNTSQSLTPHQGVPIRVETPTTPPTSPSKPAVEPLKTWYESEFGLGQKEGELYLMHFEIERKGPPDAGYKILYTHPRKEGQQIPRFVPEAMVEKLLISGRTVTSSCPKCNARCSGELDQSIYFGCRKCGFTWWQRR